MTVKIWVDADACPNPIKHILFKAAQRKQLPLTLVANQYLQTPASPLINAIQVPQGFDVADNYIVDNVSDGDMVITQDIPLAAEVIEKGAQVISPRGEKYSKNNIAARLTMRNFMEDMRAAGEQTGGPKAFSPQDTQQFANSLDQWLARQC